MRRSVTTLIALSLLIGLCAPAFTSYGQKPDPNQQLNRGPGQQVDRARDPFQPGHAILHKLPDKARIGSTPERIAALNNLSPEEREKVRRMFQDFVAKARQNEDLKKHQDKDLPISQTLSFKNDKDGTRQLRDGTRQAKGEKTLTSALKVRGENRYLTLASTITPSDKKLLTTSYERTGIKRAHALKASALSAPQSGCSKGPEQFVRTFFQGALARQPYANELSYWMDTLAQAQSQGTTLAAAQSLGNTLFQSQEYANRGRSNRDFVFDCYEAFLQRDPDQGGWDFWTNQADLYGQPAVLPAFVVCDEFRIDVDAVCSVAAFDGDQDGLADQFENKVADAFTPFYHISAGEQDQFATFNDSTVAPETIKQLFGQTPVSHFRVHKEGFATDAYGNTVGVLRIDYLTIWNYDDGLLSGAACAWDLFGLDDLIAALSGHYLDHERSNMLVAAPISGGDYSLDPGSYSLYNLYTAGHEFTVGDTSMYLNFFYSPVPAYNHIELALSRSKHATYTFNPDYMPLTPWYIIDGTYAGIDLAYYEGWIPWYWYLALQAFADDVFFSCVVERFAEQGGQYAALRTDVGEPGVPLNQSSFIAVPEINRQFTTPYYH